MTLKARIIHEALVLFSTRGFQSTSITDILERAGTSKGGLYNHFKSKEELFLAALSEARRLWRERVLEGVDPSARAVDRIRSMLENYRDRYLPDDENLPGGCVFVNLAVELNDQQPHLAEEVNEGFNRFKGMLKRLLAEEEQQGRLKDGVDIDQVAEMLFAGILGACVMYTSDRSREHLALTIGALIEHLSQITH